MSSRSSPIKPGHSPFRTVTDTKRWLKRIKAVTSISHEDFSVNYLPAASGQPKAELVWTEEQESLVDDIRKIQPGHEKDMYTGAAPLIRLCNTASKRILDSLPPNLAKTAVVFYPHHKNYFSHPFFEAPLAPDVVVTHEDLGVLSQLLHAPGNEHPEPPNDINWSNITAIGEAKVVDNPKYQAANYLRNQLQLRPDLNSILGFSAKVTEYSLFYHDASVIQQSPKYEWTSGPLHAFIRQLYHGMPSDPSIINLRPMDSRPSWGIKVETEVFVTISAKPDPGLGQRRFTSIAKHVETGDLWFIKDFYRDDRRRFFEGVLYNKAHKGRTLPGLMRADLYGYPLSPDGRAIKTTKCGLGPHERAPVERSKMRVATRDVGQALGNCKTVGEFLHVMYDACVVQRSLYRKCKILHRDISDNNIMIAPKDGPFLERCVGGYDDVKYLNQVLAPTEHPRPACLVVDLGNGAELGIGSEESGVLAERTGTPKFISRSVSKGELLSRQQYRSDGVAMPKLSGEAMELYLTDDNGEYEKYNRIVDKTPPPPDPNTIFSHHLFHDAESTFWVIAWFLARSAPKNYKLETSSDWSPKFQAFIRAMESHYPTAECSDPRADFSTEVSAWRQILHPQLASMADMLAAMHQYIIPEWGYRPELDPEHVHEALMRLLLLEIVVIRNNNADIELNVGTRTLPVVSKATSSFSTSLTTASSNPTPTNCRKRTRSQEGDDTGSAAHGRSSLRQVRLRPLSTGDVGTECIEELLVQARKYPWIQMPKWLEYPNCTTSHVPE